MLSQIAGVIVLIPALQFGQLPNIADVGGATKEAFQATADALGTIETKGKNGKSAGAKKGAAAAKSLANQNKSGGTMFSKLGERANNPDIVNAAKARTASAEEQEKRLLSFLGSSSDMAFRGMLSLAGLGLVWCIGSRLKTKVTDLTTGRRSLSKSRIVRR